jgi:hypothetical protein
MSCLCTLKVGKLMGDLLPMFPLAIALPPIPSFLDSLSKMPGGGAPAVSMSDNTRMQVGSLLNLHLPALSVDPLVLGQLQSLLPTILHVKSTLGVNLLAPSPGTRLGPIMAQANLNLPALLPLAAVDAGPLMKLSALLLLLDSLKASLGVNLLKPGAQLSAALNLKPIFPVAPLAALAPYGVLTGVLAGLGFSLTDPAAMAKLKVSLTALAAIPVPPLAGDPGAVAKVSGLLLALSTSKRLLGFSPIGAGPQLAATLAPLAGLSVVLAESLGEAAMAGTLVRMVLPLLKFKPAELAKLNVSIPPLPMPDFSAAATAGSIMSAGGLGSLKSCGPVCGMSNHFAPAGVTGRISALFGA